MTDDRVVVGYCNPGLMQAGFHESLLSLMLPDAAGRQRIAGRIAVHSGPNVASARNGIVRAFLGEHDAAWLWMVDTDMVFAPDTLERLLLRADPSDTPIVGGLCFGANGARTFPTLYGIDGDDRVVQLASWAPNAMFQVAATGAACLLVHRGVFEKVAEARFSDVYPWFAEGERNGQQIGEDVMFCLRAGECGFPVHVDTDVPVGHIKAHTLTAAGYLSGRPFS